MGLIRRVYGAHPLHFVVLVASFALAGYAAMKLLMFRWLAVAIWFGGAAVCHDLLLLPLYGIADAGLVAAWRRRGHDLPTSPWVNYVRFPAVISGVLLLVYLPEIFRLSHTYPRASALSTARFFGDWLLVTGIAFGISALLFAVRLRLLVRRDA